MRKTTIAVPDGAIVFTESVQVCMMSPWSGCKAIVTHKDRRAICPTDYQVLYGMVADGQIKWEEAEAAGMCLPRRRQTQKRVLHTILTRRAG